MVTFAVGNWSVVDDEWVLESCPAGHATNDLGDACVVCLPGTYSESSEVAECAACPAGTYSTATGASNSTTCTPCLAGSYSLITGAGFDCTVCPAGGHCPGGDVVTFAVGNWSVVDDKWVLGSCPSGHEAGTGYDMCVRCPAGEYSLGQGLHTSCMPCPTGGNCLAGSDQIVFEIGNWSQVQLDGQLRYQLDICPSGYVFATSSDGCVKCGAGFYSRGARTSVTSCLPCPAGGDCRAGGDAVLFPLGTWGVVNDAYVLGGCPIGYELTASIAADECENPPPW